MHMRVLSGLGQAGDGSAFGSIPGGMNGVAGGQEIELEDELAVSRERRRGEAIWPFRTLAKMDELGSVSRRRFLHSTAVSCRGP